MADAEMLHGLAGLHHTARVGRDSLLHLFHPGPEGFQLEVQLGVNVLEVGIEVLAVGSVDQPPAPELHLSNDHSKKATKHVVEAGPENRAVNDRDRDIDNNSYSIPNKKNDNYR